MNGSIKFFTTKIVSILFVFVFFIALAVSTWYTAQREVLNLMDHDITSTTVTSTQIAVILGKGIENGLSLDQSNAIIQDAITTNQNELVYHSVINWSGKIISHPDATKIDHIADYYEQEFTAERGKSTIIDLHKQLVNSKKDIILNMQYIANTDWLLVSHLNYNVYKEISEDVLTINLICFAIFFLFIAILYLLTSRYISVKHNNTIQQNQVMLTNSVSSLNTLNNSLENYQQAIVENFKAAQKQKATTIPQNSQNHISKEVLEDQSKSRILTYVRNELLSLSTEDIAYIYVENTITYFVSNDGKKSTSNESLEQVFSSLDKRFFFKANRQFVVSISSIDKILKYGNNQLKLVVKPNSSTDIIIGKNKASSFKKWLDS